MQQGTLVALESIDGAGTTTQLPHMAAFLRCRGHVVHTTAEPSGGPLGQLLRAALHGQPQLGPAALALLFAADRLDHLQREIEPQLAQGAVVLSDRYLLSSYAYQGGQLPLPWVEAINAQARRPDLTLFFRVSPATAAARRQARGGRRERFDDEEAQRRIAARYEEALQSGHGGQLLCIDADSPVDTVTEQACGHLAGFFGDREAACPAPT